MPRRRTCSRRRRSSDGTPGTPATDVDAFRRALHGRFSLFPASPFRNRKIGVLWQRDFVLQELRASRRFRRKRHPVLSNNERRVGEKSPYPTKKAYKRGPDARVKCVSLGILEGMSGSQVARLQINTFTRMTCREEAENRLFWYILTDFYHPRCVLGTRI